MYVHTYVSITLRNVAVTSRWNVAMSRLRAYGIRNVTCVHVRIDTPRATGARALAVGAGGSRTTLDRARGLEENGVGPSGGGVGESGIFNHRGRGQGLQGLGI